MLRNLGLVLVALAGCEYLREPYPSETVSCGQLLCPRDALCSDDGRCVTADEVAACDGHASGSSCTTGSVVGICHGGACTASLDTCGDGVTTPALAEECDCGVSDYVLAPTAGCTGFNSDEPGATCHGDCTLARCGDAIVDPSEACDDGNTAPYDGCNAGCSGRFQELALPAGQAINAIWTTSPTLTYAVAAGGIVLQYDGSTWSTVAIAGLTNDLTSIVGSGPNDVWIHGNAQLAHYDGTTWTLMSPPDVTVPGAIWSLPGHAYVADANSGVMDSWDGSAWATVTFPAECSGKVAAIGGTSTSDIYVGTLGTFGSGGFATLICHYNGAAWTQIYSTNSYGATLLFSSRPPLYFFQNYDATFYPAVHAVGPTGIGAKLSIPDVAQTFDVTGPNEVLVVGSLGTVLSYDVQRGAWTHLVTSTETALGFVAGSSPQNVFILGADGVVLH